MMLVHFPPPKRYCTWFFIALLFILLSGCQKSQQESMTYPKKPPETENRKAGPAMLFMEQAEKDMDVNDSVIVTPPAEVKE